MFDSSINKYFSSPNTTKEKSVKINITNEIEKPAKDKIISNNNETINMSNTNITNINNNEQEAFLIIKELNKKLIESQEEINKKNQELEMRKEELELKQNYNNHIENLTRKIKLLEDKIKVYKTDSDLKNSKFKTVKYLIIIAK